MIYVFVTYNSSLDYYTPESWYKRTEGYAGILKCLAKDNTVINIKQINYIGNHVHNGIHYRFIDFGKKKTYLPWRLNLYIKNLNPDVVVIQGLHNPLQLMQLHFLLNKKAKIIAHHHAEKPFMGLKKYAQRIADCFIDAYLFAAKPMAMEWVQKGNMASLQKVHEVMEVSSNFYPMDKTIARTKTGITAEPVFLWVGRLNANKDPLNVLKAFLKFAFTNPSSRLYMIYHTDELLSEIKKLLQKSNGENKVILVGQVPHSELLYWFNSAAFFLSGSHYEGSGTAVCEAMSCGCVPIVTDIFSFRMITDNGNCGILYEAGNEEALSSALLQTKDLNIQEKQKNSIAYFKSNLSFQSIANQIHEVVCSL